MKTKQSMKFRMESELLGTATFSFDDENDITHTVTNDTSDGILTYTEYRNGFILEEKFQNIYDLMLYLRNNNIDTEDFFELEQD